MNIAYSTSARFTIIILSRLWDHVSCWILPWQDLSYGYWLSPLQPCHLKASDLAKSLHHFLSDFHLTFHMALNSNWVLSLARFLRKSSLFFLQKRMLSFLYLGPGISSHGKNVLWQNNENILREIKFLTALRIFWGAIAHSVTRLQAVSLLF